MLLTQEHSCWWRGGQSAQMLRAVDENAQLAAEIRAWMRRVMQKCDITPTEWAKKAGVARTTVARPLKEGYEFVTSSRTLSKLAAAVDSDPPPILNHKAVRVDPLYLPVRYRVQAGHWIEVDVAAQEYPAPPRAVAPDPAYSAWPQWLELVVGDSIDREIQPGSYAHVVDAVDMGYAPQQGDFVVVERRRDQGRLRERSIKQVEIKRSGRVELWPRSTNPMWNKPLELATSDETAEVHIVGLVIGAYRGMR
jgi:hypothetical protein